MMGELTKVRLAHVAAIEGRMDNVRRRHETLRKLCAAIEDHHEELLATFSQEYGLKESQPSLLASLSATTRSIKMHAGVLDLNSDVMRRHAIDSLQSGTVHVQQGPMGLVVVMATEDALQYPVDAIFSPLIAATAAGNSVVVVLPKKKEQTLKVLDAIFKKSFPGNASVVTIDTSEVQSAVRQLTNMTIFYQDEKVRATQSGHALVLPISAENAIVVDANIVNADVYRTGKRSRHDVRTLQKTASSIYLAQRYGQQTVFVSENILPALREMYMQAGGNAHDLVSTTSIEHTIALLSKRRIGHLSCFTTLEFGSFYSTNVAAQSVSLNDIPLDLLVGYCPSAASVQVAQPDGSEFNLMPLWDTALFTQRKPVVNVIRPTSGISKKGLGVAIPAMQRKKVKHLEFFPTGFVITFFPTFAALVGLTGVAAYRLASLSYRFYTG